LPDGSIRTTRSDGTVTIRTVDGWVIIRRADGMITTISTRGTKVVELPDGTVVVTLPEGTIVTFMPDGRVITQMIETEMDIISDGRSSKTPLEISADTSLTNDLQDLPESNKDTNTIDLGSLVAGFSGWGLAGITGASSRNSLVDREGFKRLDEEIKNRKFLKWKEGKFVKDSREKYEPVDRKKLH